MKLGLLWYDADKRVSPQARLAEAATRFAERFGRRANCCHVNPTQMFDDPAITVVADASVLKDHFWVGRDEALEPARPRRSRKAAPRPVQPEAVLNTPDVVQSASDAMPAEVEAATAPRPADETTAAEVPTESPTDSVGVGPEIGPVAVVAVEPAPPVLASPHDEMPAVSRSLARSRRRSPAGATSAQPRVEDASRPVAPDAAHARPRRRASSAVVPVSTEASQEAVAPASTPARSRRRSATVTTEPIVTPEQGVATPPLAAPVEPPTRSRRRAAATAGAEPPASVALSAPTQVEAAPAGRKRRAAAVAVTPTKEMAPTPAPADPPPSPEVQPARARRRATAPAATPPVVDSPAPTPTARLSELAPSTLATATGRKARRVQQAQVDPAPAPPAPVPARARARKGLGAAAAPAPTSADQTAQVPAKASTSTSRAAATTAAAESASSPKGTGSARKARSRRPASRQEVAERPTDLAPVRRHGSTAAGAFTSSPADVEASPEPAVRPTTTRRRGVKPPAARPAPAPIRPTSTTTEPASSARSVRSPATPVTASQKTHKREPKPTAGSSPSRRATSDARSTRTARAASQLTPGDGDSRTSEQPVPVSRSRRGGISEASRSHRAPAPRAGRPLAS